jgi:PAS domain S-box-containing protein
MAFVFEPAVLVPAILEAAETAGIGVTVSTVDGDQLEMVFQNAAAETITGWSSNEMIGRNPLERLAAEERPRLQEMIRRRSEGEEIERRFETTIVHKSGRRVPVWFATCRSMLGDRPLSIAFFADITKQKESEARFQSLTEGAPDAIVISREARVVYANRAAARLLGYDDASGLIGVMMSNFLPPDEMKVMRDRVMELARTKAHLPPREYRANRKDGTPIVAEITSLLIEYEGVPAVVAIARDVTDRVRMQAQLAHADRLAALGTLAAGVAHEVNNPLAYLALGLDALKRQLERSIPAEADRTQALGLLREVRDGADRVARIVRELRTFARREDDDAGAVDLRSVIASAERMVAREVSQRATLTTDLGHTPPVLGSASRLEQVFVNLLLNAAQAIEEGKIGHIIVRTGNDGDRVFVEIVDDGHGIKSSDMQRIFDPFFTTKPPGVGTGLGLFVCIGIVRQLGGEMTVESVEKRGTTFRVTLPIAHGELAVTRDPASVPQPLPHRASILIVDDEPNVGSMLAELLGPTHDVTVVRSGEAALRELLGDRGFDVVICDLVMPGMSGMDLYEHIARERPGIEHRFVLMTGGAFTPRARKFLEDVPNHRLDKPFRLEALEAVLARHLERSALS